MIDFFRGSVTPRDWAALGGIVGLTLILMVLFVFFVHQGQRAELATIGRQNVQVEKDLTQARKIESEYEKLEQDMQEIRTLVEQFEDRLPARGEIPTLLDQFEALARDVDVNVQLDTLPRTTDERKETIPYNIHARGTFHQIANFINRLERFQRYLKVSDLNIGPEIAGICEASFTLSTFRFIEPKEPTEPTEGNAT
jgi:Tfp pilus assembly protein PilO